MAKMAEKGVLFASKDNIADARVHFEGDKPPPGMDMFDYQVLEGRLPPPPPRTHTPLPTRELMLGAN